MSYPGQQPYHYPSAPYPGPPVRRRRSRWLTVGLPVGLVVLVLVAVGIVVLVRAVAGALTPVSDAAGQYAQALVDGRWDDAQAMLCEPDRSVVTADDLAQRYGTPPLTGYDITGVYRESGNGIASGSVELVLSTGSGLDDESTLPLVREQGRWRPCP